MKGHEISMNTISEVISTALFLDLKVVFGSVLYMVYSTANIFYSRFYELR